MLYYIIVCYILSYYIIRIRQHNITSAGAVDREFVYHYVSGPGFLTFGIPWTSALFDADAISIRKSLCLFASAAGALGLVCFGEYFC